MSKIPPTEQAPYPIGPEQERRTLGYSDTEEPARLRSQGGLPDDPTESGMPVKNRQSFKITKE